MTQLLEFIAYNFSHTLFPVNKPVCTREKRLFCLSWCTYICVPNWETQIVAVDVFSENNQHKSKEKLWHSPF